MNQIHLERKRALSLRVDCEIESGKTITNCTAEPTHTPVNTVCAFPPRRRDNKTRSSEQRGLLLLPVCFRNKLSDRMQLTGSDLVFCRSVFGASIINDVSSDLARRVLQYAWSTAAV